MNRESDYLAFEEQLKSRLGNHKMGGTALLWDQIDRNTAQIEVENRLKRRNTLLTALSLMLVSLLVVSVFHYEWRLNKAIEELRNELRNNQIAIAEQKGLANGDSYKWNSGEIPEKTGMDSAQTESLIEHNDRLAGLNRAEEFNAVNVNDKASGFQTGSGNSSFSEQRMRKNRTNTIYQDQESYQPSNNNNGLFRSRLQVDDNRSFETTQAQSKDGHPKKGSNNVSTEVMNNVQARYFASVTGGNGEGESNDRNRNGQENHGADEQKSSSENGKDGQAEEQVEDERGKIDQTKDNRDHTKPQTTSDKASTIDIIQPKKRFSVMPYMASGMSFRRLVESHEQPDAISSVQHFNTHEKQSFSFRAGATVSYPLGRNFDVISGVQFSQHRQTMEMSNGVAPFNTSLERYQFSSSFGNVNIRSRDVANQENIVITSDGLLFNGKAIHKLTSLHIPLGLRYSIPLKNRHFLTLQSSVLCNVLLSGSTDFDLSQGDADGYVPMRVKGYPDVTQVTLGADFGVGYGYVLSKNKILSISPTVATSINPLYQAQFKTYPYWAGVIVGMRFSL